MEAGDYIWQGNIKVLFYYFTFSFQKVIPSFESTNFLHISMFTCDNNATFNAFRNIFSYVAIFPAGLKSGTILKHSHIVMLKFQLCSLLKQSLFLFCLGFLSRTFMIHRTAGEGVGYLFNSSLPLPSASRTLRY